MAKTDTGILGIGPERLLAFSDGVFAIIITIMVLELKVPHSPEPAALLEQWPLFLAYALSYLQLGIYWVNHHALFAGVEKIDHRILWWNLLILFFLSLVPFATAFAGETAFASFPTAVYALVSLMPAVTWNFLHPAIVRINPGEAMATRSATIKGYIALALYVSAVIAGLLGVPYLAVALIFVVAIMYFLPTRYF